MEVKKAIRKVVAVAAGATMMGATLFSALAADLNMYPEPFVKNGEFNGFIVVGDNAAAEDVVGAVDIGASLQFEMRKETTVSLGSADVLISDGIKIKGTGTLLISYKSDQQDFFMINLLLEGVGEQFQIQSSNLFDEKIVASEKLLSLGGTKVDLQGLFDKKVVQLDIKEKELQEVYNKLGALNKALELAENL